MHKRKGFTLIELVIVVAIIGILSMIAVPKFNEVTEDAKNKTWESNCQVVVSAIAMYMAANNGNIPTRAKELDNYINGGFNSLWDTPKGAIYQLFGGNTTYRFSASGEVVGTHTYGGTTATYEVVDTKTDAYESGGYYFLSQYKDYTGDNPSYIYSDTFGVSFKGHFQYKIY